MRRRLVVLIVGALVPAALLAQRPCLPEEETYLECLNRLFEEARSADGRDAELVARSEEALAEAPTSDGAGGEGGGKRDYLARFFAALGLGTTSQEDGNLILNLRTDFLDLGPNQKATIRAVVREPELHAGLVEAIPESIRSERRATLEASLEDLDDVRFEVSWNSESKRLGRALPPTAGALLTEALARARPSLAEFEAVQERLLLEVQRSPDFFAAPVPKAAPAAGSAAADFEDALEPFAASLAAEEALIEAEIEEPFQFLAELADNQPQLHVDLAYVRRGEVVGPDEYGFGVTYEHGFVNLNRFLAWQGGARCASATGCLAAYRQAAEAGGAAAGTRAALRFEWSRVQAYDFALPADAFQYNLDEVDKRVGSLTFARHFGRRDPDHPEADPRVLFELSGSYEDLSDDPTRQNRLVATARLSRKVSEDLTAGLTLAYANKPEFRGEVDEELSARVGLKFSAESNDPEKE